MVETVIGGDLFIFYSSYDRPGVREASSFSSLSLSLFLLGRNIDKIVSCGLRQS